MSVQARMEAEIELRGPQPCYLLGHSARGWYWRMQVIFSWLWEKGDALHYCSCHPGSCIILGVC